MTHAFCTPDQRRAHHLYQIRLQMGERFFNRREIREVGRQKQQLTAFGLNRLPHTCTLMASQIIQDDDLLLRKPVSENLLDVNLEGNSISCTCLGAAWHNLLDPTECPDRSGLSPRNQSLALDRGALRVPTMLASHDDDHDVACFTLSTSLTDAAFVRRPFS